MPGSPRSWRRQLKLSGDTESRSHELDDAKPRTCKKPIAPDLRSKSVDQLVDKLDNTDVEDLSLDTTFLVRNLDWVQDATCHSDEDFDTKDQTDEPRKSSDNTSYNIETCASSISDEDRPLGAGQVKIQPDEKKMQVDGQKIQVDGQKIQVDSKIQCYDTVPTEKKTGKQAQIKDNDVKVEPGEAERKQSEAARNVSEMAGAVSKYLAEVMSTKVDDIGMTSCQTGTIEKLNISTELKVDRSSAPSYDGDAETGRSDSVSDSSSRVSCRRDEYLQVLLGNINPNESGSSWQLFPSADSMKSISVSLNSTHESDMVDQEELGLVLMCAGMTSMLYV